MSKVLFEGGLVELIELLAILSEQCNFILDAIVFTKSRDCVNSGHNVYHLY